jgi:tRNA (cytidine/uridine-2'-O-)-methyltransferase
MFHVVLFQPEIPPNTGNIIRLCANTGCQLHLIEPLGFDLDDKRLRRAGLDYHEYATLKRHHSLAECITDTASDRILAFTTKASNGYAQMQFRKGDLLLFGPESRGLPADLLAQIPDQQRLRLPMRPESRSLNLSNAVAVVVFEAWRQHGFAVE